MPRSGRWWWGADGRRAPLDTRRREAPRRDRCQGAPAQRRRHSVGRHGAFRHRRPCRAIWCRRRLGRVWLHSSPVIPDLGFCLGTRAQMFWLEEGHPASLAPGKRPRSTLTPTLALRDGEPYLAWGSPGGDQQDQWITQFFLRHVHGARICRSRSTAPAWHSEHFSRRSARRTARPGVIVVEGRVPKATQDELRKRGHKVEVGPDWSEGRLTAASRDGRRRRVAANPRGTVGSRSRSTATPGASRGRSNGVVARGCAWAHARRGRRIRLGQERHVPRRDGAPAEAHVECHRPYRLQ